MVMMKLPVGGNGDLVLKCLSCMTWDRVSLSSGNGVVSSHPSKVCPVCQLHSLEKRLSIMGL